LGIVRRMPGAVSARTAPVVPDLTTPPQGLSDAVRAVWQELAPGAVAHGTLGPHTAIGFRLLCEVVERQQRVGARIDEDGWTYADQFGNPKKHPLWSVHLGLLSRMESLLHLYALLGDGKVRATADPAPNPWADIAPGV